MLRILSINSSKEATIQVFFGLSWEVDNTTHVQTCLQELSTTLVGLRDFCRSLTHARSRSSTAFAAQLGPSQNPACVLQPTSGNRTGSVSGIEAGLCSAGLVLQVSHSANRVPPRVVVVRQIGNERASEPGFTETSATRNRETTVVVACQSNKSKYPCKSGQMTNDSMFFLHLSAWCQDMGVRIPLSKVGWDAEWGSCG